jgi:threonine dehydrogenase-like Zn-dependent dehydrogenase
VRSGLPIHQNAAGVSPTQHTDHGKFHSGWVNSRTVSTPASSTPRAGEAVIRITTTTICGTDVHIVRGEYPVKPGGHEPVGVIDELGAGLEELYRVGQRVIVGAITPCGQCFYCLNGTHSQCGGGLGGWRFGNTINGAWAEYLLVPDARANLAPIPDELTDEQVMLCPDIFSTGLSGAESGNIRVGDSVAIFAQGPIGLCATLGAKLKGASLIIGLDLSEKRLAVAREFGANVTIDIKDGDRGAGAAGHV